MIICQVVEQLSRFVRLALFTWLGIVQQAFQANDGDAEDVDVENVHEPETESASLEVRVNPYVLPHSSTHREANKDASPAQVNYTTQPTYPWIPYDC